MSAKTQISEIQATLAAMIQQGQVVELRCLGVDGRKKRVDSGYFDDMQALASAAYGYNGRAAIYITPNPVAPDLLSRAANRVEQWVEGGATTADPQIVRYRWLLIDADPKRVSGISATDAEHAAALQRIQDLVAYLTGRGWPAPIYADSGNGAHADYYIDLPNDEASKQLIRRCLLALDLLFSDDQVTIDTGNFNPARIWKLYGTKAIKGDDTPTRPHRWAEIIAQPDHPRCVTVEQLQALADLLPADIDKPQAKAFSKNGSAPFDIEAWMAEHGITGKAQPWQGGTVWVLDACPFSSEHTDGARIGQQPSGAVWASCHHNSCQGKDWHALKALYEGSKAPKSGAKKKAAKKAGTYLVNARDHCEDAGLEALVPGWDVLWQHGEQSEQVHIKAFIDFRPVDSQATRFYAIEESADAVPETELFLVMRKSVDTKTATWEDYTAALTRLGYAFRMNDLDDTLEVNGAKMSDGIEAQIIMQMHDEGFKAAEWIRRACTATAHLNRYHPVKDFLSGLRWDGKDWLAEFERYVWDKHPRIMYADGLVLPVFGAWLKRWGIGAVAKVLKTGPVRGQNTVLTLAGPQNVGKSTLARFLCPLSDDYFIESHIDPESNDHNRYLATKLCWEVAELGATTRKADRESLKSFITRQDCTFRTPYAHHPVTKPALTSFIGTINPENGFLNDPTGNRRFLPVELTKIDFAYVKAIDPVQLWAQFVALYNAGESAKLTPEETAMADSIRSANEVEDAYKGFVLKYYDVEPTEIDWVETTTEIVDQLAINGVSGVNVTNIGLALKKLGLERQRETTGQKRTVWRGVKRNTFGDKYRR